MDWKILFVGDIVLDQQPARDLVSHDFAMLMPEHDICACNFEAPVSGKGQPIKKAGPHVHQHPKAPFIVEEAGFNLINLANNHIYDYGEEALADTIKSFQKSTCVGAGMNFNEAYALKQANIKGLKIGFLSFCEAEFGALTLHSKNKAGYAWINHPLTNTLVSESKKNVDLLIIQAHAGIEQIDIPIPIWRERYKELIRSGADLVIGHHPHVPQGWETYRGKPIFYSLGNFYFDLAQNHPLWNKGIAVSISYSDSNIIDFKVLGIEKTINGVIINNDQHFQSHLEKLNKVLEEPLYSDEIDKLARILWEQYYKDYYNLALHSINSTVELKTVTKTFIKRLFFKKRADINYPLLLHNIRIESHRWIVEHVLEEITKE